jgi:hypothetical protein
MSSPVFSITSATNATSRVLKINYTFKGLDSFYEKYDLNHAGWTGQYAVVIYFSSTTMITVGYGDIVP